jgi:hypothetical protein
MDRLAEARQAQAALEPEEEKGRHGDRRERAVDPDPRRRPRRSVWLA